MTDCVGTERARMSTRGGKTKLGRSFMYYIVHFCKYFFSILSFGKGQNICFHDSKVSRVT